MKKKRILTEEAKAKKKIYQAKWRRENKEAQKIWKANWYQENREDQLAQGKKWNKENPDYIRPCEIENPNYQKEQSKKWQEANPDYVPPCRIENPDYYKKQGKKFREANPEYSKAMSHKHDLGYWVVYLIHNYNGLGDTYCGQTGNVYNRMKSHKSDGRLNTETYEIIKQLETLEDALEFEAYMHEQGYDGKSAWTFI